MSEIFEQAWLEGMAEGKAEGKAEQIELALRNGEAMGVDGDFVLRLCGVTRAEWEATRAQASGGDGDRGRPTGDIA